MAPSTPVLQIRKVFAMSKNVIIDGIEYAPILKGSRAVVVVDRGWIFAGDVREVDGRIYLSRAVWVFRWESVGFDNVIKNPSSEKVKLRVMDHVIDIPSDSEIFRIPVDQNWGLS